MWEFTKTADGSFELTDSSGATLFTPRITFGDDRMSYWVDFESRLLGLASGEFFVSAPHSITPHRTIARTLSRNDLYWGTSLWSTPAPAYFRGYVLQNPAKADELLASAAEATAVWRVYINGEPKSGLMVRNVIPSGRTAVIIRSRYNE